jgi:hypothetical protein
MAMLAGLFGAPASAAARGSSACGRTGVHVVAQDHDATVFANDIIFAGRYACLRSSKRLYTLSINGGAELDDVGSIHLVGHFLVYYDSYDDGTVSAGDLIFADLERGTGRYISNSHDPFVTSYKVASDGGLVVLHTIGVASAQTYEIYREDRRGVALLDRSSTIDPGSLTLASGAVSWTDARVRRTASLVGLDRADAFRLVRREPGRRAPVVRAAALPRLLVTPAVGGPNTVFTVRFSISDEAISVSGPPGSPCNPPSQESPLLAADVFSDGYGIAAFGPNFPGKGQPAFSADIGFSSDIAKYGLAVTDWCPGTYSGLTAGVSDPILDTQGPPDATLSFAVRASVPATRQRASRADAYLKARLFTIAYQALISCHPTVGAGERCQNGQLHLAPPLTARTLHIGTRPGQVRQTEFSRSRDVFKGVSTSGNTFTIIQRPTANLETSDTYVCRTAIAGAGCLGRRW